MAWACSADGFMTTYALEMSLARLASPCSPERERSHWRRR
jgi:hypothetical protein